MEIMAMKEKSILVPLLTGQMWFWRVLFMQLEIGEIGYLEMEIGGLPGNMASKVLKPLINKLWFRLECIGWI